MKIKLLILSILVLVSGLVLGQRDTVTNRAVLDGAYGRENDVLREPIGYQFIREADAMYSKKVLRFLDLNEKRNHPLYFPTEDIDYLATEGIQPERSRRSLYSLIIDVGIKKRELPCFMFSKTSLDMTQWYKSLLPVSAIDQIGKYPDVQTFVKQDMYGQDVPYDSTIYIPIDKSAVKAFFMWEEWFFDKQRSVMDVRIIALAPYATLPSGQQAGLFWIHYPHFRSLFVTNEVFNSIGNQNDAERMTFDDVFFKRLFSSYIFAETNVYDNRMIEQYLMGIEAIREGERIQDMLAKYEHDQWEY
ncbi:MAG: gliding motility protein GldN [Bacteroidales bacterium]|nr:gliding motility protein GldN [Bacteroidales bacterium]